MYHWLAYLLLQDMLFKIIQDGVFCFPEREWADISDDAKDLICHLLKREPRRRYSAKEVLDHPWISNPVPNTLLATPSVLSRFVFLTSFPFPEQFLGSVWTELIV